MLNAGSSFTPINLFCPFFIGSESRLGGVTFELLANEALERHRLAFGPRECDTKILRNPGFLHYRSGNFRSTVSLLPVRNLNSDFESNEFKFKN